MTNQEFENFTKSMQEKLGKENTALIADDIAKLIMDNSLMNKEITTKQEEITKLQSDKETLMNSNVSLLQQVAVGTKPEGKQKEETENKDFDFSSVFDEKGHFKVK